MLRKPKGACHQIEWIKLIFKLKPSGRCGGIIYIMGGNDEKRGLYASDGELNNTAEAKVI